MNLSIRIPPLRTFLLLAALLLLTACPSEESVNAPPTPDAAYVAMLPIDTSKEAFPRNPATLVAVWLPYADSMPSHATVFGMASVSREYTIAKLPFPSSVPDSLLMRAGMDSLSNDFYRFGAALILLFDDPNGVLQNGYKIPLVSIGELPDGIKQRGYVSNAAVVYRHDPASALMSRYPWMESFTSRYTKAVGVVDNDGNASYRPGTDNDQLVLTIDSTGDGFIFPGWMP
jgi:hypothetical protein